MRYLIISAMMVLLLSGCLDLLEYSESTYVHTLGVPANSSRYCVLAISEPTTFYYEISSPVPVTLTIVDNDILAFNETTGEPIPDYLNYISKAYNVMEYSKEVDLGEGLYAFIISSSESCSGATIKTNIRLSCQ